MLSRAAIGGSLESIAPRFALANRAAGPFDQLDVVLEVIQDRTRKRGWDTHRFS